MSQLQIDGVTIDKNTRPYLIAEVSANHNGSIDKAKECITAAARAGASAVKIQTYTADTMTIDSAIPTTFYLQERSVERKRYTNSTEKPVPLRVACRAF